MPLQKHIQNQRSIVYLNIISLSRSGIRLLISTYHSNINQHSVVGITLSMIPKQMQFRFMFTRHFRIFCFLFLFPWELHACQRKLKRVVNFFFQLAQFYILCDAVKKTMIWCFLLNHIYILMLSTRLQSADDSNVTDDASSILGFLSVLTFFFFFYFC